jgi:hypothetical protein
MNITKGPWDFSEEKEGKEAGVWGPDGDAIAYPVYGNLGIGGEATDNARVISCSLEMLEILIKNYIDLDQIDRICEIAKVHPFNLMRKEIKDIIEKATNLKIEEVLEKYNNKDIIFK